MTENLTFCFWPATTQLTSRKTVTPPAFRPRCGRKSRANDRFECYLMTVSLPPRDSPFAVSTMLIADLPFESTANKPFGRRAGHSRRRCYQRRCDKSRRGGWGGGDWSVTMHDICHLLRVNILSNLWHDKEDTLMRCGAAQRLPLGVSTVSR